MSETFDLDAADFADTILTYLRDDGNLPATGYFREAHREPNMFDLYAYCCSQEELLTDSNFAYVSEALEACEGFHDGELTALDAAGNPTPALRRLAELLNDLADYPILDGDDYSARQCDYAGEHGLEYFGDEVFDDWRAGALTHCAGWCGDPDTVPAPDVQPEAESYHDLTGDALAFITGHAMSRCLESDCCY